MIRIYITLMQKKNIDRRKLTFKKPKIFPIYYLNFELYEMHISIIVLYVYHKMFLLTLKKKKPTYLNIIFFKSSLEYVFKCIHF